MNEITWIPTMLLSVRAAAHFLIFLRVASYMSDPDASKRKAVGILAALFAGFNLAEAIRILSNFASYVVKTEPYLPGIMVMVLVFVTWSGGNLAKFLPRKILERLP